MGATAHSNSPANAPASPPAQSPALAPDATAASPDATARDGQDLLQATKAFAQEDPRRSWWHFLETVGAYVGALALTTLPVAWPLRLLASALAALVTARMFMLYHDHQHGALLRGSGLANAYMSVFGVYCLNPPSIWKRSHNYHHKHNAKILGASIGSFPVMTTKNWRDATPALRRKYALSRHPVTIILGYFTIFLFGMCLKSFLTDRRRHWDSALALALQVGLMLGVGLTAGWDIVLFTIFLPLALTHILGAYLFYVQHNFPGVELKERRKWTYTGAALRSSSYFEMSPVMHWFTGNIGYHHVHHLNPRIPFYRLPEAMDAIPELQSPGRTSWRPRAILAALRLKLWDPERNAMVGFDGVQ